jgi:hypothetical protein
MLTRAWLWFWPGLVAALLALDWRLERLDPIPPALRCEGGEAAACAEVPRDDAHRGSLLIACAGGTETACDALPPSGPPRVAALTTLCQLGAVARCREVGTLTTGDEARTALRIGCVRADSTSCLQLAALVSDPVQAHGLVRSACLLDAKSCLAYGDQAAAAGDREVANNAWDRACQAGVAQACSKKGTP